jgi:hypothetical protein
MKHQAAPSRGHSFSSATKTAPTPERVETASAHRDADRATAADLLQLRIARQAPDQIELHTTTHLRPSPVATAGTTSRGVPALYATHCTEPAREAGRKEERVK